MNLELVQFAGGHDFGVGQAGIIQNFADSGYQLHQIAAVHQAPLPHDRQAGLDIVQVVEAEDQVPALVGDDAVDRAVVPVLVDGLGEDHGAIQREAERIGVPRIAAPAGRSQSNESVTRTQADDILKELRLIRELLERQQAPQGPPKPSGASVAIPSTDPVLGKKDAPVTVVEYTDYQCSFCQRFHVATFPELKKNFIDTGKIRFYSRDMPLDFHQNALKAAEAARCAGDQNQFWTLRDLLVANASQLDPAAVQGYVGKLAMDQTAFKSCMNSNKYAPVVRANLDEAARIGLEGTPSFVVGKSTPEGVTGALVVGAQPYSVFEKEINKLLAK